jgi:hypothetical protein
MTPLPQRAIIIVSLLLLLRAGALRAQAGELSIPPNSILPNYNRVAVGQREALEGGRVCCPDR